MMMHKLEKASSPGWEKEFATKEEATAELRKHICKGCLTGEDYYVGEDGKGEVYTRPAPNPDVIEDLLGTPCGCEFWYEPPSTSPLSSKDSA